MTAARTDLIVGLPDRVATLFAKLLPLKVVTPAFPMPSLVTVLAWHERTHADPGARYFRELIVNSVGAGK
jgi:DNA-binding transcriptional LysR family regulator